MADLTQRDQVFISYSHKDKRLFDQLQTTLKPLVRSNKVSVWDDTKIKAGDVWREEIKKAIDSAKVAVLLVSPDYLACDFIAEHELLPLLEASQKEGLIILWVALRYSLYNETVIARYQAVNNPSEPLAGLSGANREKEFVRICEEIKTAAALTDEAKVRGQDKADVSPATSKADTVTSTPIQVYTLKEVVALSRRDKALLFTFDAETGSGEDRARTELLTKVFPEIEAIAKSGSVSLCYARSRNLFFYSPIGKELKHLGVGTVGVFLFIEGRLANHKTYALVATEEEYVRTAQALLNA
jgi:hypothetical protein